MAVLYRVYRHAHNSRRLLWPSVQLADTAWRRFRGLLGRSGLADGEGLLLMPCASIHTIGMRFALDAVFLDEDGVVLRCESTLQPNRYARARGACYTLELAAGALSTCELSVGDYLSWETL